MSPTVVGDDDAGVFQAERLDSPVTRPGRGSGGRIHIGGQTREAAGLLAAFCLEHRTIPRGVRNNVRVLQEFQTLLSSRGDSTFLADAGPRMSDGRIQLLIRPRLTAVSLPQDKIDGRN
jgi:hypothetical protein